MALKRVCGRALSAAAALCMVPALALALFAGLGLAAPLRVHAAEETIDLSKVTTGAGTYVSYVHANPLAVPPTDNILAINTPGTYTLKGTLDSAISSLQIHINDGVTDSVTIKKTDDPGQDTSVYDGKNLYIVDARESAKLTLDNITFTAPAAAVPPEPGPPTFTDAAVLSFNNKAASLAPPHTLTVVGNVVLNPPANTPMVHGLQAGLTGASPIEANVKIVGGAPGATLSVQGSSPASGDNNKCGTALRVANGGLTINGCAVTANVGVPGDNSAGNAAEAVFLVNTDYTLALQNGARLQVNGLASLPSGSIYSFGTPLVNVGELNVGATSAMALSGNNGSGDVLYVHNRADIAGALSVTADLSNIISADHALANLGKAGVAGLALTIGPAGSVTLSGGIDNGPVLLIGSGRSIQQAGALTINALRGTPIEFLPPIAPNSPGTYTFTANTAVLQVTHHTATYDRDIMKDVADPWYFTPALANSTGASPLAAPAGDTQTFHFIGDGATTTIRLTPFPAPAVAPAATAVAASPKTGDGSALPLWALCGGAALAGLALCGAALRRRRGSKTR